MGRGRMLAFGGLAAAGLVWFGRYLRRQESLGDDWQERRVEDGFDAPDDPVDEAIAESFPASDPPSFAGSRRTGEG